MTTDKAEHFWTRGRTPRAVLVSDLRRISDEGFVLVSDPQTVEVAPERLVFRGDPATNLARFVAVLGPEREWGLEVAKEIAAALEDPGGRDLIAREDIVDQEEIGRRFGVSKAAVEKWRQRNPDFPEPLMKAGNTPVWDFNEIQSWRSGLSRALPPDLR